MRYIRLFEEDGRVKNKKFWKIRPTSVEYAIVALDKIGMPKNDPYRKDLIRRIEASSVYNDKPVKNSFYNDKDFPQSMLDSWMVKDEKTLFVVHDDWYGWNHTTNDKVGGYVNSKYEYMDEVKVEPHEVEANKYNL